MHFIFFIFLFFIISLELQAEDVSNESITLPEIEIQSSIGDRTRLTPGSTNYVDRQSIDKSRYLTVGEILQEVPGVISEIDDGDSRKSNFGIRGAHSRRSRKISVYEDYIPNNFAPYTDPTTHYTPPDERIAGIEVIKGSGQLTHGPQTMYGIINFLNYRPPTQSSGKIITSLGSTQIGPRKQFHVRYGKQFSVFGNWQAMFTRHDNRGPVHGDITEYNDFFINGDIDINENQKLALTFNYNEEDSEYAEGGLGLSQYNANKQMGNLRLGDDIFKMDMARIGLAHSYYASDTLKVDTNFYYNFFYRTRWSQTDNDESAGLVFRKGIGCTNEGLRIDAANITNAGCGYKVSPRRYHTAGIETRFYKQTKWFDKNNDLKYGAKLEFEKLKRKQWVTTLEGNKKDQAGDQFVENEFAKMNEEAEVYALATYFENDIQYSDKLTLTPGIRYESYFLIHNDRENRDGCGATGVVCNDYTSYEKDEYILLPGLGFTYLAPQSNQLYGGIHMGMAPPAVGDAGYREISNLKSQKSFNFELGIRNQTFENNLGVTFEAAAFRTVERNRPVKSSLRTAGTGSTLKNIGTTFTDGIEFSSNWDQSKYSKKLNNWFGTFSYSFIYPKLKTHQKGERSSSDPGSPMIIDDIYENDIPFIPRHKAVLTIGYGKKNKWNVSGTARYNGEYFTDIDNSKGIGASGRFGQVDDYILFNSRLNYQWGQATFYISGTNLLNTPYIASVSAEGLKTGNGRTLVSGMEYNF